MEQDCENCLWPENAWKEAEVKKYYILAKAQRGGLDVNRIYSLSIIDYLKLDVIRGYMNAR